MISPAVMLARPRKNGTKHVDEGMSLLRLKYHQLYNLNRNVTGSSFWRLKSEIKVSAWFWLRDVKKNGFPACSPSSWRFAGSLW